MEVLVDKITDEQAGNVLGAIAAANVAEAPKKMAPNLTFRNKTAQGPSPTLPTPIKPWRAGSRAGRTRGAVPSGNRTGRRSSRHARHLLRRNVGANKEPSRAEDFRAAFA